jgi:quinol monooxygenase YgiN
MLIVSGIIEMDPSGHDRAVELFGPLVAATLEEPGCITYGFWADPSRPGRFRVYEEWESEDAITEHFGTPHMAAFMAGMAELPITSTDVHRHEVTNSTKLM